MIFEIFFWFGLTCGAIWLLGFFFIGNISSKQKRDTKGRFVGKGSIYGPMSNITHNVKINSPMMTGLSHSKYPGKLGESND